MEKHESKMYRALVGRRLNANRKGGPLAEYIVLLAVLSVLLVGVILEYGNEVTRIYDKTFLVLNDPTLAPPAPPPVEEESGTGEMVLVYIGADADLSLTGAAIPGQIDWGDGTVEPFESSGIYRHTFTDIGPYHTVRISGHVRYFRDNSTNISRVEDFGDVGLESLGNTFAFNHVLEYLAPVPETVTTISNMLRESQANPLGLAEWNTANITDMHGAFFRGP